MDAQDGFTPEVSAAAESLAATIVNLEGEIDRLGAELQRYSRRAA